MVRNAASTAQRPIRSDVEPRAILIRTPNWLGDLLVSTAFIRAVLQRFPAARVDLIVRQGFEALPLPQRGSVYPFDRHTSSPGAFGRGLRGLGHTHMFVLPPSFSSAWMAWRTGIRHRIGYRGEGRRWLLRPARAHNHGPRSVHLAREYLELLSPWVEAMPEAPSAGLEPPAGWVEAHRPEDAPSGEYVVLAPGAEYGPAKMWPPAHYEALAAALDAAGWPVVVAGLGKDRLLGESILAGTRRGVNLCGETDLPGLAALLAGARLLVSNDSGAMHLGAAWGVPQLALFGSTNPTWTGPLNPRAEVLYRAEPCSPCYARQCPLGHLRCLQELQPALVTERALALLGESPAAAPRS
ncbi:MAG TPA: lipopolysaccharide heptosyltransferase II [bacterium]|nr:lipopolysaccharide heptosyltransferase II [bacterium]